ncbi:alpha/beta fold hydrolase [Elizabethkingia meningoseptica]|uniref:alpha/beta fold hydrolase n=1 Tax=Elizabethkingia meningoseptica TaxID=238 RepID=UPI000332C3D4|nr:alpha/beta fold hydrolase [Elizabethkingia meningoseptica]AQX04728.1 homoserine acetyltransferase [Elizabethkingia meningoseptica]AQX46770.1 homoserine acetyltransferase [Elizabethkingia meningoseptica]EOR31254.1 bifunctional aspartokinase I/homoserine dehydrogenase I [Elizabethkingia meningoseptica ATCC 13253 = NBRC 12535]KUY19283.1 homoserine acetyltransferase [Elizabethkingia meningoseptica]MDE5438422.1 alpha/beta fold hydrolase [Elizabethkingia meningoseptica]
MKDYLNTINIKNFTTQSGKVYDIPLTYEVFGQDLYAAPVVLVNHALTGNSAVTGEIGWWKEAIGKGKPVDTDVYTILAFNIPGNGYDGFLIDNPKDFVAGDIARLFLLGLEQLKIKELFAIIGGSLGGGIGWEMLNVNNNLAQNFIPVATDWKTSDWLYAQCMVQDFLLNQQDKPLQKARIHAMLCYRTPQSLNERFGNKIHEDKELRKSEDWLNFHGERLNERFTLSAYKIMNQLLSTIETVKVNENSFEKLAKIKANIFIVSVDSDLFFPASEDESTYKELKKLKDNITHFIINSVHGHDAFLMEYEQLNNILHNIFKK